MKSNKVRKINLKRTIWVDLKNPHQVKIIDQRYLPHKLVIQNVQTLEEMEKAIKDMQVRGAPLIGVSAAYGIYLALINAPKNRRTNKYLKHAANKLIKTRPTAINLSWAVKRMLRTTEKCLHWKEKIQKALETANEIANEDAAMCKRIGEHGVKIIQKIYEQKGKKPVNILTHCNAGWLACVEWGTATSPIYHAFLKKIPIHVWVDETRPRNQGASLTAWELGKKGVPHTIITDNAGGHLMQRGLVDLVLVGADRVASNGDFANKIGTYLKALAAKENHVPFYALFPSSTIDWKFTNGLREIPIEKRSPDEVKYIQGLRNGKIEQVLVTPEKSPAENYGFDVTPGRIVTGFITERGVCSPNRKGLLKLYPEHRKA